VFGPNHETRRDECGAHALTDFATVEGRAGHLAILQRDVDHDFRMRGARMLARAASGKFGARGTR